MFYVIIPIVIALIFLSYKIDKSSTAKIVEDLTILLELTEWQARVLKEYLER